MKTILKTILICLLFAVNGSFAQTEVSGAVSGEWTAEDSPYIVVDSTWIPEGDSLTVGPGVEVLFEEDMGLWVLGHIIAMGQEEDTIRFEALEDNTTWQGVFLIGNDEQHEFDYCTYNAPGGIILYGDEIQLYIGNSVIVGENQAIGGVSGNSSRFSSIVIEQSVILSNRCLGWTIRPNLVVRNSVVNRNIYGYGINAIGSIFYDDVIATYADYSDCRFLRSGLMEYPEVSLGGVVEDCYSDVSIRSAGVPCRIFQLESSTHVLLDGDTFIDSSVIGGKLDIDADGREDEAIVRNSTIMNELDINSRNRIEIFKCIVFGYTKLYCGGIISVDSSEFHAESRDGGAYERLQIGELVNSPPIVRITRSLVALPISISSSDSISVLFENNTFAFYEAYSGDEGIDNHSRYCSLVFRNNIVFTEHDNLSLFDNPWAEDVRPLFQYNLIYGFADLFIRDRGVFEIDSTNLGAAPMFISIDSSDYHLREDSPCIDAGDPDSPYDPDGTRADIGAYFYPQWQYVTNEELGHSSVFDLVSIYPNPCNSSVTILNLTQNEVEYEIYDLFGRAISEIGTKTMTPYGRNSFNIQNLSTGIYFLVSNQKGRTVRSKLIVQK